jgi:hypothetical protein
MRQSEAPPDDPAVAEEPLDLLGTRRRSEVEVLGVAVEQEVAHAAPDEIRNVVELPQAVQDLERVWIDLLA